MCYVSYILQQKINIRSHGFFCFVINIIIFFFFVVCCKVALYFRHAFLIDSNNFSIHVVVVVFIIHVRRSNWEEGFKKEIKKSTKKKSFKQTKSSTKEAKTKFIWHGKVLYFNNNKKKGELLFSGTMIRRRQ